MSMALLILKKLAALSDVQLPHLDRVVSAIEPIQLEPGECAFRQGDTHPYIYCVRSGLLKQYYTDIQGNAWIKSFTGEGLVFACLEALQGASTIFSSEAIEPSVVERLHYRHVEELAAKHSEWMKAVATAYASLARLKVKRERDLMMLTAEQLYESFVHESPALAERVPQKDLAGFIGVTPVGLNRIVKRCRLRR